MSWIVWSSTFHNCPSLPTTHLPPPPPHLPPQTLDIHTLICAHIQCIRQQIGFNILLQLNICKCCRLTRILSPRFCDYFLTTFTLQVCCVCGNCTSGKSTACAVLAFLCRPSGKRGRRRQRRWTRRDGTPSIDCQGTIPLTLNRSWRHCLWKRKQTFLVD